ncbi:MAG: polysaccharide biosynthesis tyrosine autokinase [Bacteroidetes bacterium]|nr:polysaccharide biosynthesis tyrosine autokinase [Bacteroidota bacterium]
MANQLNPSPAPSDDFDFEKLRAVFKKKLGWVIAIFFICNLSAYLTTRWTKDIFESDSELKLDIKQDATDLGINKIVQDQNLDIISGEIEQIKSKLFLSRVIDSLDLSVGYFSEGNVLYNELYRVAPFRVKVIKPSNKIQNTPIYFFPINETTFAFSFGKKDKKTQGKYGEPIHLEGADLVLLNTGGINDKNPNDFYFIVNSKATLINYLTQNLSVEPLNFNARTIRISFKDYNAFKASDVVNKIDSLYITYSNELQSLANKQKIDWLNKELNQVEKRMEAYEDYFESFTLQNKSNNLGEDMKRTILQINRVDSQRYSLSKKIIEVNTLIEGLVSGKNQLTSSTHYLFLPDYLNKKMDALVLLTKERNRLSLSYNENTFAFRQKEKELNQLKDEIFNNLNLLKENWSKTAADLTNAKQKLEREFNTMPDKNTRFTKNQRFYSLYSDFYLSMMQSKAQFEIAQAGTTPDFKILSSASFPSAPIWPRKIIFLAIGFVAGIVLNFFFIGLVYLLDNTITSSKEVERLINVPLLGVIPASRNSTGVAVQVRENPKSMVSEAIRSLRTNLDFFTSAGNKKIITITSSVSGEGKSFLAVNLGGVLAMSKKKVALIDLDMRKLKTSVFAKEEDSHQGLSTILIKKNKWQECIRSTGIENLSFLPAGPHPPNPSELLLNGEFSSLIEEMQHEYDFIIMDTPPVGLVTDGIMAMNKSDFSIYVVRANYSKKEYVKNIERIKSVNKINNVAVVLNALPPAGKAYGYGYYIDKPGQKT